jgi:phage baseplate assembly protein W
MDYLGRRWEFPIKLDERNQIGLIDGDAAIRQAIRVIIYTVPGERVMHPTFGCEIHSLLFAPANEQTAATAERYVRDAITRWEPRITLRDVNVTPQPGDLGALLIAIRYEIKNQPDPRSLVFPYYLMASEPS